MKITKLPDKLDLDKLIKNQVNKHIVCPYCGEDRSFWDPSAKRSDNRPGGVEKLCFEWDLGYYAKADGKKWSLNRLKFWEPTYYWKTDKYQCFTCGMEWESDPYPTDMGRELFKDIGDLICGGEVDGSNNICNDDYLQPVDDCLSHYRTQL